MGNETMKLEKMKPTPYTRGGDTFRVFCIACGVSVESTDVMVDVDGKYGDFYCPKCVSFREKVEELANE